MPHELTPAFDQDLDLYVGTVSAPTKLVWFLDYTCPITRRLRDVMQRTAQRFGGQNALLAMRFLPEEGSGSADIAARAAIAAARQDQLQAMNQALFSRPANYTRGLVCDLAEAIGLDMARFKADLDAEETTRVLQDHRASAAQSRGVITPSLFIDGVYFDGVWDETSLIEAVQKPIGVRLRLASNDFFEWAASAGVVLIMATLLALVVANIGWHDAYEHLRETEFGLSFGEARFALPLEAWINDGLMALFFLLVGIEIKRELVDGELSDPARAALPIIGAVGGMLVPALIYFAINAGGATAHGWGVPMATDIAFTLGIMALLGDRVPTSLKVFVSALAIADDLGAIIVIAIFSGHGFHMTEFLIALGIFAVMLGMNRGRIYGRTPYLILGVALWYFVHESGLHATLAGVMTALAIPSRRSQRRFSSRNCATRTGPSGRARWPACRPASTSCATRATICNMRLRAGRTS